MTPEDRPRAAPLLSGRAQALGSIRAVLDPDAPLTETGTETDKVVETRDYYPFGLRMPGRTITPGTETAEDYTGHELDSETGMHYAGARYYMSALGRWNGPDPLADDFPAWSPYNYSLNRPVNLHDPNGRAPCCLPTRLAEQVDTYKALLGDEKAQERIASRWKARGAIAVGVRSAFLPGPEDAVLAAAAGTKVARAAAKYADEAGDFVKGLFRGGNDAAADAIEHLKQGGKLSELGVPGDSEGVRILEGGVDDAQKFAEYLSGGDEFKEVADGVWVAKSKTGSGNVTFRPDSNTGGPAVDTHGIEEPWQRIHFE